MADASEPFVQVAVAVELLVHFVRFVLVEVSEDDAGREREPVMLATFRPRAKPVGFGTNIVYIY